ncbi:MAG: carbon-nitrogen hydrolase family protein [Candidatus Zixiibacteriota bacterium]
MLIKVVAFQGEVGRKLTLEEKIYIFKQRPDFVCLPEYFLLDDTVHDYHRAALKRSEYLQYYASLSYELATCLVAGTCVEAAEDRLYNTAYVFNRGQIIGSYRKKYPVPREQERGITPGADIFLLEIEGVRVGLMICGDVFHRHLYEDMFRHRADIIFIPTTSSLKPDDSLSRKRHRDKIYFIEGSEVSGAYVVKVCGVGRIFNRPLQGRSLITAPWGILDQTDVNGEHKKRFLTVTLDITEVRDFRKKLARRQSSVRAGELLTGVIP